MSYTISARSVEFYKAALRELDVITSTPDGAGEREKALEEAETYARNGVFPGESRFASYCKAWRRCTVDSAILQKFTTIKLGSDIKRTECRLTHDQSATNREANSFPDMTFNLSDSLFYKIGNTLGIKPGENWEGTIARLAELPDDQYSEFIDETVREIDRLASVPRQSILLVLIQWFASHLRSLNE